MSLAHHKDHHIRYTQQFDNARNYLIPFIAETMSLDEHCNVLDIGCGDGGVMGAMLERGCSVTGIELNKLKFEFASDNVSTHLRHGKATLININIYEEEALIKLREQFDLIILKDVIEHIPHQEKFIPYIKQFLKPGGRIFFGFPPWYMPHGGHQQICNSRLLGFLPYFHLLPVPLYKAVLKAFGEHESTIHELMEIKDTGISIERFERIVVRNNYEIEKKQPYLINPIYEDKFGWKPRKQFSIINHIPFFRNFITTCVYYVIRKK